MPVYDVHGILGIEQFYVGESLTGTPCSEISFCMDSPQSRKNLLSILRHHGIPAKADLNSENYDIAILPWQTAWKHLGKVLDVLTTYGLPRPEGEKIA